MVVFAFVRTRFSGLPLLTRPLLLRASGGFPKDRAPINFEFLLASAHDPSIESSSRDGEGIMSSGSGDLVPPLVWRRGGVALVDGGLYSSSRGEYSGLSTSPSTTQDSPNCNFPRPGAMVHVRCRWQVALEVAGNCLATAANQPCKLDGDSESSEICRKYIQEGRTYL
jgi:hypothetical protein